MESSVRRKVVATRWALNITRCKTLQGDEKQLAEQHQTHNLVSCHLKFGKLVSAVKQPIWYVYNSIPEQNIALIYLNQMFFIVLYSIVPIIKSLYYSLFRTDLCLKICLQSTEEL